MPSSSSELDYQLSVKEYVLHSGELLQTIICTAKPIQIVPQSIQHGYRGIYVEYSGPKFGYQTHLQCRFCMMENYAHQYVNYLAKYETRGSFCFGDCGNKCCRVGTDIRDSASASNLLIQGFSTRGR